MKIHVNRVAHLASACALAIAGIGLPSPACAQRTLFVDTFDAAWQLIYDTHFDPEFNGVDWLALRDELRPQAEEADTNRDLRQVIEEMLSRLGQSHFALLPSTSSAQTNESTDAADAGTEEPAGESACDEALSAKLLELLTSGAGSLRAGASPGLEIRLVADRDPHPETDPDPDPDAAESSPDAERVLVVQVDPERAAAVAGVKLGWQLRRIGEQQLAPVLACLATGLEPSERHYLITTLVAGQLTGPEGTSVDVELVDGDGRLHRLELERTHPADGERVRFGNLPPIETRLETEWRTVGEDRIGIIRWNIWMVPIAPRFQTAMIEMSEADGLILDLRGNPGGVAALTQGIAGYFFAEPLSLGTMKTRRDSLELRINPRRVTRSGEPLATYNGPVALLIDGLTASASEIFAAALQDLERARLFGEPTAGEALPAAAARLPNGDVLIHATGDFIRPSGERVEGRPVTPDQAVPLTRAGLLAGRDEPLEEALRWLHDPSESETNPLSASLATLQSKPQLEESKR